MPQDILTITHNPELGEMLTWGLPLFGFTARSTAHADAVARALSRTPDAILIEMPWNTASTLALIDRFHRVPALVGTPIICLTTDTRPARWDDVRAHGADDLLLLPVQFAALADRLRFHTAQSARRARYHQAVQRAAYGV